MKALIISFLFFLLQLSIFGQLLIKDFNLGNPVSSDSNYVPLQVGNTWQYMRVSYGPFGYGYGLNYSTVYSDTAINEHIYYKMTDFSDYIRYSKSEKNYTFDGMTAIMFISISTYQMGYNIKF